MTIPCQTVDVTGGVIHENCTGGYNRSQCCYYRLDNNKWGKGSTETLTLCVYYDDVTGIFGWRWNRPTYPSDAKGPIYPTAVVGRHPWDATNSSTWLQLPKQYNNITSFKYHMGYKYPTDPTLPSNKAFNFAPEIWFADTVNITNVKKVELMIWMECSGLGNNCIGASYLGDFNDGYKNYKVYVKGNQGSGTDTWFYAQFLRQPVGVLGSPTIVTYYSVDVKAMVDYLISKQTQIRTVISNPSWILNTNWYITNIEFGNEIYKGSGKIEINKLDVELNNTTINLVQL